MFNEKLKKFYTILSLTIFELMIYVQEKQKKKNAHYYVN